MTVGGSQGAPRVPQGARLGGLDPTHLVASMVAFALGG
jgi:hypothetical protein